MRFLYVCSDFGVPLDGRKGASIHVREMSRALQNLGHDVVIVTPRRGGNAPPDFDVPALELEPDPLAQEVWELLRDDPAAGPVAARELRALVYDLSLARRALPLLRDFDPDVVYERYALFARAGGTLARSFGVPHIVEVNAPLSDEEASRRGLVHAETARRRERAILHEADHLVAVSPELERWLTALGIQQERVSTLPNAVDPDRFAPSRSERELARARLGFDGQPVVGFVGSLRPWHGTRSLVRAVALLHRRGLPARLLVVGDGPERSAVEALAQAEGVAPSVTLTGAVPHDEVCAYLLASDVAVATYEREPGFYFSPLKLFEYLAAGLPVVAADIGELKHCVRHEETGLLYPPGDVEALADALATLLADRRRADAFGRAGRDHVLQYHTWSGNGRLVSALGAKLAERPA
jgi:glycosyltransferase involved in cell wall biosynthesis